MKPKTCFYQNPDQPGRPVELVAVDFKKKAGTVDLASPAEPKKVLVAGAPVVEGTPAVGEASFDPRPILPPPEAEGDSAGAAVAGEGGGSKEPAEFVKLDSGVDPVEYYAKLLESGEEVSAAELDGNCTAPQLAELCKRYDFKPDGGSKATKPQLIAAILGPENPEAGGDQAGGDQAGGDQAGGDQAGGDQAGGDQAGDTDPAD